MVSGAIGFVVGAWFGFALMALLSMRSRTELLEEIAAKMEGFDDRVHNT